MAKETIPVREAASDLSSMIGDSGGVGPLSLWFSFFKGFSSSCSTGLRGMYCLAAFIGGGGGGGKGAL